MTFVDLQNHYIVLIGGGAFPADAALAKVYTALAALLGKQADEPHWSKR